jgi:hypothetical protein
MNTDIAHEAALEAERLACRQRVETAAKAALQGDYSPAQTLVETVRQQANETVAQRQRREIWNYVKYLRQQRALGIPDRETRRTV